MDERFYTSGQLQKLTGLSRASVARLAPDIHGAERYDGCHYRFLKSPELEDWIQDRLHRKKYLPKKARKRMKGRAGGVPMIEGVRQLYDMWAKRVTRDQWKAWPKEMQNLLLEEIRPIMDLGIELEGMLVIKPPASAEQKGSERSRKTPSQPAE
jgi:hypothetical protein